MDIISKKITEPLEIILSTTTNKKEEKRVDVSI